MQQISIDINADVGEGIGNEVALLPLISSCNIACGGHAGDLETMRTVVQLAKQHRVKIGAHPSFPDQENFGRTVVDMSCAALFTSIKGQVKSLMGVVREEHAAMHHVKPHGALYNLAAVNKDTAMVIIEVMKSIALPLELYVPYGSVIADLAVAEKIPIMYEAFADRNYNEDLTLVSRKKDNAIITDSEAVFRHVHQIVKRQKVRCINGIEVPIKATTFCIHGDNPEAIILAENLRQKLTESGIKIQ